MEGVPVAVDLAPRSPPPKKPIGSFPEIHYSPGKLYTSFRIADGKSPLAWRKTKVFQADQSPGSAEPDASVSPSPARMRRASRRLDTSGGPGGSGETTPTRLPAPSIADALFRANVPAARLLQRLQGNKNLPPLVRKREHDYVQRRLLALVQLAEPRTEAQLDELRKAAATARDLPTDAELPALERRFAKAAAARSALSAAAKLGVQKSAGRGAKPGRGAKVTPLGKGGTPKRRRPAELEDEALPISGGVSKISGRTLYIPARLRGEPASERKGKRGTPARAGAPAENGTSTLGNGSSARKVLKGPGGARIKVPGVNYGSPFSPGGTPMSPGEHLRERHSVRVGEGYQAELPAEEAEEEPAKHFAASITDREDMLIWSPPEARSRTPSRTRSEGPAAQDGLSTSEEVDRFLAKMRVLATAKPSEAGGTYSIGGPTQERCLELLLAHGYGVQAAQEAIAAEQHTYVTWNQREIRTFNVSLKSNGFFLADQGDQDVCYEANLRAVQKDVKTKAVEQVTNYFYLRDPRTLVQSLSQAVRPGAASPAPQGPPRAQSPAPSSAAPSASVGAPSAFGSQA